MLIGSCSVRLTSRKPQNRLTSRSKRSHSDIAKVPLFLSQELGSLGVIGQEEPNENTNNDSGDTLENEPDYQRHSRASWVDSQPLPAVQVGFAGEETNTGCDETTECSACQLDRTTVCRRTDPATAMEAEKMAIRVALSAGLYLISVPPIRFHA
jgi:hypothetical protein